jgi:hypothetical protein
MKVLLGILNRTRMPYFVYILRCCDGSFYTGRSPDPERRLSEHNLGIGGDYTSRRRPVELVWSMSRATTIPQVRGLQGQMIPQFWGQMIPQFWGQIIPQFQGQIIPHFQGQMIPQFQGRIIPH